MKEVNLLAKAISIASLAHINQLDKGGRPYILHPIWIMTRLEDDEEKQAGVLHDVVEDCQEWTLELLRGEGFSDTTVCMIDNVTKREDEKYWQLIDRASTNPGSKRLKMLDLRHNSNILRVKGFTQSDINRIRKYQLAYHFLKTGNKDFRTQLIEHINYCGK